METRFSVSGQAVEPVDGFRYLGRMITATDSDFPAVLSNLHKARLRWSMVSWILPNSIQLKCGVGCEIVRHIKANPIAMPNHFVRDENPFYQSTMMLFFIGY